MKELGLREVWGLAGQMECWGIGSNAHALFPLPVWKSFGNSHKENLECDPNQPCYSALEQLWWHWVSFLEFPALGGQAEWGGFGVRACVCMCVCVRVYVCVCVCYLISQNQMQDNQPGGVTVGKTAPPFFC